MAASFGSRLGSHAELSLLCSDFFIFFTCEYFVWRCSVKTLLEEPHFLGWYLTYWSVKMQICIVTWALITHFQIDDAEEEMKHTSRAANMIGYKPVAAHLWTVIISCLLTDWGSDFGPTTILSLYLLTRRTYCIFDYNRLMTMFCFAGLSQNTQMITALMYIFFFKSLINQLHRAT